MPFSPLNAHQPHDNASLICTCANRHTVRRERPPKARGPMVMMVLKMMTMSLHLITACSPPPPPPLVPSRLSSPSSHRGRFFPHKTKKETLDASPGCNSEPQHARANLHHPLSPSRVTSGRVKKLIHRGKMA